MRAELLPPGCSPERALAAFTSPEVPASWWHGELTAELVPGGPYEVWFAKVPARMTGRVIRYVPASVLEFSWAWDYPPDPLGLAVTVQAGTAAHGSATLEITHGPHGYGADGQAARAQHREGWEHFLPSAVLLEHFRQSTARCLTVCGPALRPRNHCVLFRAEIRAK